LNETEPPLAIESDIHAFSFLILAKRTICKLLVYSFSERMFFVRKFDFRWIRLKLSINRFSKVFEQTKVL